MTEALGILSELAASLGVSLDKTAALFARLSLVLFFLPGIAGRTIPIRVRLALALTLTFLILPLANDVEIGERSALFVTIANEAFLGFLFGFSVRVFLFSLGITGSIIAQAMSLSQVFGVSSDGDNAALLSTLLSTAAAALFLALDLEVTVIYLFAENIRQFPLGEAMSLDTGLALDDATRLAKEAISFGVMLGLPFMVLNFAYYLILGFLNRAMPQLMVTFVGLPAITLSGLILLMVSIGGLLTVWLARVEGHLS